ncbi:MAG: Crp/Fnr family transcriptional regulator [Cyanobacteria bacterium CRU_2_1]|nr:Crp/Fnr family transcriptional regulator [Cyanobacteria bacterium RU_5_0]NJR59267.1 Crp/Fnr family transcriptional regulator [Cyanobacteria bacterium CRU_2_1]
MSFNFLYPSHLSNAPLYTFKYRECIPLDENALWQIDRGIVRTSTWDQNGTSIILGFWGAEDIVGQPLSRIEPYRLECMTEVTAYTLPEDSAIANQALLSHVQQAEEFLRMMHCRSIEKRLLQFLIWLADKFGQDTTCGQWVELRLTHQEMADTIGTTRVTVTRLLGKFEQEGIVRWSKQRRLLLNQ